MVSEDITAALKQKTKLNFGSRPEYFVLCNQEYCQYVEVNKPPCPLNLEMFKEELREIEEKRLERKMGAG